MSNEKKKSLFETSFGSGKEKTDGPSGTVIEGSSIPDSEQKVKDFEQKLKTQEQEIKKLKNRLTSQERSYNSKIEVLVNDKDSLVQAINQQELSLAEARKIEPKEVFVPLIPTTTEVCELLKKYKNELNYDDDTINYCFERLVTKKEISRKGGRIRNHQKKGRDIPTIKAYNEFLRFMVKMGELP
ncbi:hypothetical protein LCGC14_0495190 [marine sediment metagenome]|uniref:Uncharacterized protein n=1 Tax=marine sediment metagenome TaxID=412755 RepID=A0A0F9SNX9_9ZZZZ